MRKPRKTPKLTMAQMCMTANFYDAACDYPRESAEQIKCRMLGAKGFPPKATEFKKECRKAFELAKG